MITHILVCNLYHVHSYMDSAQFKPACTSFSYSDMVTAGDFSEDSVGMYEGAETSKLVLLLEQHAQNQTVAVQFFRTVVEAMSSELQNRRVSRKIIVLLSGLCDKCESVMRRSLVAACRCM